MLITDAQVHVWEVERPDRPWPKPLRNQPQLPDGFSAEAALAAMDEAGIDRAIIVPPTWVGDTNATAKDIVTQYPERFAIMGRFDPTAGGAEEALAHWLEQPNMLGVRMTFRVSPFKEMLDGGGIDWFWTAAEAHGVPVACLVPGEASKLQPIASRHPGLTLLVDHMACIMEPNPEVAFSTLDQLTALATYPNVHVKVSSAPCYSAQDYPFADVQPYLKRIYDAFGPQRMIWGADLTRLKGTYEQCLSLFRDELDFLSLDDKEWVLGRTVAEVLNWRETPER
jgi:predicted TIM-barrel fold metal-dependent hydrolase